MCEAVCFLSMLLSGDPSTSPDPAAPPKKPPRPGAPGHLGSLASLASPGDSYNEGIKVGIRMLSHTLLVGFSVEDIHHRADRLELCRVGPRPSERP